jgi:hypothetical protein
MRKQAATTVGEIGLRDEYCLLRFDLRWAGENKSILILLKNPLFAKIRDEEND